MLFYKALFKIHILQPIQCGGFLITLGHEPSLAVPFIRNVTLTNYCTGFGNYCHGSWNWNDFHIDVKSGKERNSPVPNTSLRTEEGTSLPLHFFLPSLNSDTRLYVLKVLTQCLLLFSEFYREHILSSSSSVLLSVTEIAFPNPQWPDTSAE